MKKFNPVVALLFSTLLFLPGCGVIAGIFQTGFWAAIILGVAVLVLVGWGFSSFTNED